MTTLAENVADITGRLDDGQGAPVAAPQDDPFAFLLDGTEQDLIDDFATLGIDVGAPSALEAPQRQAAASMLLRRAALARREAAKLEAARDAEIALIEMHYAAEIGRQEARARQLEDAVTQIAEIAREAGDFGKKKSASTPFGTFGFRETAATVELEDASQALAFAREHAPECVKADLTLPLTEAREYFTDDELAARNALSLKWGEFKKTLDPEEALPPGVKVKPASREFFAKPDVQALTTLGEVRA